MITYYLGLPGSGKTYKAVETIYNNFSDSDKAIKDKKATYTNCYTNINEFKFDEVKNVYEFDFDNFYSVLEILHQAYKDKQNDEYLLDILQEHKYKDTLFIIDESHKHFDVEDKILVWWLSYHRHLHHEIILITQSLSLIHLKYKKFSEFFYEAKPRSLVLFNKYFKYNIYCSSRLSEKSKSGSIKVKMNAEVFELYKSGDSINSSNVILKFLMISAILLIVLIVAFYLYIGSLSKDESVNDQYKKSVTSQRNKTVTQQDRKYNFDDEVIEDDNFNDKTFFTLSCAYNKCSNEIISIPPKLLALFIHNKSINVLYKDKINNNLVNYYIDSSTEFYNYLIPKRSDNEDNQQATNSQLDLGFLSTNTDTSKQ